METSVAYSLIFLVFSLEIATAKAKATTRTGLQHTPPATHTGLSNMKEHC